MCHWPLEELFGNGQTKMRETQLQISRSQYTQSKLDLNATVKAVFNQINIARQALRAAEEGFDFASEALSQSIDRQQHRTAEAYEVFQA